MPHNPVPDVLAVHRNYYQIVSVNTTLGVGFFCIGVGFLHRGITVSSLSLVAGAATTRELMSQLPFLFLYIAVRRGTLAAAAPLLAGVRRLHGRS